VYARAWGDDEPELAPVQATMRGCATDQGSRRREIAMREGAGADSARSSHRCGHFEHDSRDGGRNVRCINRSDTIRSFRFDSLAFLAFRAPEEGTFRGTRF